MRGVDFDIDRGQVLGLAGRVGLRQVDGRRERSSGSTRRRRRSRGASPWTGTTCSRSSRGSSGRSAGPGASIIFQGALHALNPVRRIGDQVVEAITVHKLAGEREARVRTAELLEQVGLPARRIDDYPHELSGGQKQRVMIAMALACNPSLVIADEPTTALDVMVQAQVLQLLKSLQRELGLAMLFITHDLSVLVEVADRIAIMYAGRIIEEGPAEAVFREPAHPYTKALAGAFPEIGDARFRGKPSGLGGDPPDPQHIPGGCPFHPRCAEAIAVCPTLDVDLWNAGEDRRAACIHVSGAPTLSEARRMSDTTIERPGPAVGDPADRGPRPGGAASPGRSSLLGPVEEDDVGRDSGRRCRPHAARGRGPGVGR